jgi:hypothetical protein
MVLMAKTRIVVFLVVVLPIARAPFEVFAKCKYIISNILYIIITYKSALAEKCLLGSG